MEGPYAMILERFFGVFGIRLDDLVLMILG